MGRKILIPQQGFLTNKQIALDMLDPALAAQAMIKVVETPEPPLRLVLGADALEMIRKKLASMEQEMRVWEATSLATAFASEEVS